MGLRLKIGVTITVTATLAAVVTASQVPVLLTNRECDVQRERLLYAARLYEQQGRPTLGLKVDPPHLPGPLRAKILGGHRATHVQSTDHGDVIWAAEMTDSGTVLAVRSPSNGLSDEVERVMWQSGAVGTGVATVIGLGLATRFARRLRQSARSAEQIADGDLTARLPETGRDEITTLTHAVNAMADALSARLRAEREVTANIAHELRTPVAGLIAASALLPDGRAENMVKERAGRLRDLMEDVLEVARLDSGTEAAESRWVKVSALARRVVRAAAEGPAAGEGTAPDVRVDVVTDATVETDPRRVERVLTNLVTNALRHGTEPVLVEVDGPTVRVRDHGPGFPEHLITQGPQRFRTGAEGTGLGLGLTIAVGQAAVLGAHLSFDNPDGGGAQATLALPVTAEADR
ncbi:HAMP domain-containing sensor histidine kinase [Streptomyces melanogenes]|uniref:histidine kinase n=1 Tax=Streptomyces melanogenes TaxID=67326 RepID=A0ABZ1XTL6_9ACTN|nr:HAMP domain-containing sensor histidine kinase [Streptomyces melanogenes]